VLARRATPVRPGGKLAKDAASHERPHAEAASKQPEGHSQLGAGGERRQQADDDADHGEDQRADRVQSSAFAAKGLEFVRRDIRGAWLRLSGAFMRVAKKMTTAATGDAVIRYRLPAVWALRFFAHSTSPVAPRRPYVGLRPLRREGVVRTEEVLPRWPVFFNGVLLSGLLSDHGFEQQANGPWLGRLRI